ncbi:DUF1871 family protein [Sutcliffiella horikoshii]|uniref:DUF1871 family protein n=1 Tax=Sutcliffiella horikoshii TaxID=79883 RepID=A0A5D4T7Y9_9BACI|nr:DUF1871 family protein [Sutcliffiella horikoshii]TYS70346.1 DUF1871 family protein [Sutcliffiella horikoshii]
MESFIGVSKIKKQEIVIQIINEWDPMDLLAMGAGEDRYRNEIDKIVDALDEVDSVDELARHIKLYMDASFSTDFPSITCLQVAVLIWEEINK